MGDFVHDPRHRFSYELRPDAQLDASIRALAAELEADGLLPTGAATAPRFHPHLTLLRADHADADLVQLLADLVSVRPEVELDDAGTFGGGRIAWLAPSRTSLLERARAQLVTGLGVDHVDPLSLARSPWVPHVTVAYAVDEPHRDAVFARVRANTASRGSWRVAQAWDLDVRPTRCVVETVVGS